MAETTAQRIDRRIREEEKRTGRKLRDAPPPRAVGGGASGILTQTDQQSAQVVIQGAQEGQFTTEEIQRGFANELRQLRAEAAAGIISDDGRERLDNLETLLQERAAQES